MLKKFMCECQSLFVSIRLMKLENLFDNNFRQFRKLSKLMIRGHYQSPVKHLYLKKKIKDFCEERKLLRCLSDRVRKLLF